MANYEIKLNLDTLRNVINTAPHYINLALDTRRDIIRLPKKYPISIGCDTIRSISQQISVQADTGRNMSHIIENNFTSGIKSVSLTLSERTLSDVFQMEIAAGQMNIGESIEGSLLDYEYRFAVEETRQDGIVQNVKGMLSVDALLYTPINISAGKNCRECTEKIASALGLSASVLIEDFSPGMDYSNSGMTYQDFLSALFGWTSRLPQRQINVFIRKDKLYAIQRGMETREIDITSFPHTMPVVCRKLIRSIWNSKNSCGSGEAVGMDENSGKVVFNGRIGTDNVYRVYRNGLLIKEVNNSNRAYYYYENDYLYAKQTLSGDGSASETRYEYTHTKNDIYLSIETEVTGSYSIVPDVDNSYTWTPLLLENTETRITYHAPIGHGWYSTTTYVDGELMGSTISQGKPGGKTSRYMADAFSRSLGAGEGKKRISYDSLIDNEFPIEDSDMLSKLTEEIRWLNRRTQEEVDLDIVVRVANGVPEMQHIIDFNERVRLDENVYYLVSNQVTLTPRSLKQKLKLVRWY